MAGFDLSFSFFHPPVMIRDVENLILLQGESFFSLYSFP